MASQNLPAVQGPSQSRRIAVIDIETVSEDPSDPRGALDSIAGRIVCIGLILESEGKLMPMAFCDLDEKKLLERFWATLGETDLFVGHGVLDFDLPMIRNRSFIKNVKPTRTVDLRRYYTT